MKYPALIFLFSILALSSPVFAEDAKPLTLAEAQAMALKNHPRIQYEDFKLQAADQNVNAARASYLPQIDGRALRVFSGDKTNLAAYPNGIDSPSIIDRGSYGVGVSQLITDFGRTGSRLDAAKSSKQAEAAKNNDEKTLVLLNVTRAYYGVLRSYKVMKVAEDTLKTRKSLLDQVNGLREGGQRTDLDVSIARQNVDDAELLKLQAQNGVDDAMATLSQALGLSNQQNFTLADDITITLPPADVNALIEKAMNQNPEVLALQAEAEASENTAKAEEAANYPVISAVGYAGQSPIRDNDEIESSYAAGGITLSVPIYTGGRLAATGKQAKYNASAARQELLDKKNNLSRDVRVAWNSVEAAYKNIEVTKNLLKSANEALDLSEARYDLGKISIVDLAEVQLAKTKADIASANATYDYLIQLAFLAYNVGDVSKEIK